MDESLFSMLTAVLLQDDQPSRFLETLREDGQIAAFPELTALIGVVQDPKYHPEGDVWTHTMLVIDAAASLRTHASNPMGFMYSALCHDFGKPAVTAMIDGRIRTLGHEEAGITPTLRLLKRCSCSLELEAYVISMVKLHMRPNMLVALGSGEKAYRKLFRLSTAPEDLLLLANADRIGQHAGTAGDATSVFLQSMLLKWQIDHKL